MLTILLLVFGFVLFLGLSIFFDNRNNDLGTIYSIIICCICFIASLGCFIDKSTVWNDNDMIDYIETVNIVKEYNDIPDTIKLNMKETNRVLSEKSNYFNKIIYINKKKENNPWRSFFYNKELGTLDSIKIK